MPLKQNINKHQTDTSRSADRFKVKDVYMDEADVRTTFKDKPDQRDNILNAGAAFVCPKRKVDMYAVPEYVGENEEETEHKEENIRQLEQEEKDRPPKPPKAPKPPKLPREPKPPKDNKKPLTDSQKKRLNGLKTRMETVKKDMDMGSQTMAKMNGFIVCPNVLLSQDFLTNTMKSVMITIQEIRNGDSSHTHVG